MARDDHLDAGYFNKPIQFQTRTLTPDGSAVIRLVLGQRSTGVLRTSTILRTVAQLSSVPSDAHFSTCSYIQKWTRWCQYVIKPARNSRGHDSPIQEQALSNLRTQYPT